MSKMSDHRIETMESHWYDDPDEVVAFVRWYYGDVPSALVSEVCDVFERPWEWDENYQSYVFERETTS